MSLNIGAERMDEISKILDNLRRQCSRREYCSADVLKKAEKALKI